MTFSAEFNLFFQPYEHTLVEEFFQHFNITYYIMVIKKDGSIHSVIPNGMDSKQPSSYFANAEKDYVCAIYDQDETQIISNFNRFLKVKAFL